VKPSPFEYVRATSVDDAVKSLAAHAGRAKLLAGGQSLIPMMNFRLTAPEVLIDIANIASLATIEARDGTLQIGAGTRHTMVLESELVQQHCPLLADAYSHVAHLTIRNRGTIGGNLCHHDPASEVPLVMTLLGATLVMTGPNGTRSVPADGFFLGMMETAIAEDEILVRIDVPFQAAGEGWAFEEMSVRKGDYAIVCAAVRLQVEDGAFRDVRVGFNGSGSETKRMAISEQALEGQPATDETIATAVGLAADHADPTDDPQADAAYKRDLIRALGRRALVSARARAAH
jgi:aerobic carbon-monoxide dehydrogenase medium subunit